MTTWFVEHGYYGCESGCCGMRLHRGDNPYDDPDGAWVFSHPYDADTDDDVEAWARDEWGLPSEDTVIVGDWRC